MLQTEKHVEWILIVDFRSFVWEWSRLKHRYPSIEMSDQVQKAAATLGLNVTEGCACPLWVSRLTLLYPSMLHADGFFVCQLGQL